MAPVTRDTRWQDLQAIVKAAKPSLGVRDEFVRSVQQSLRVEGYELAEAQVRRAVEAVVRGAK
jgi:hypothetical protein